MLNSLSGYAAAEGWRSQRFVCRNTLRCYLALPARRSTLNPFPVRGVGYCAGVLRPQEDPRCTVTHRDARGGRSYRPAPTTPTTKVGLGRPGCAISCEKAFGLRTSNGAQAMACVRVLQRVPRSRSLGTDAHTDSQWSRDIPPPLATTPGGVGSLALWPFGFFEESGCM